MQNQSEQSQYPHLIAAFLQHMEEIGAYGHDKYGNVPGSFTFQRLQDLGRGDFERCSKLGITQHIIDHTQEYRCGIIHDHFFTLEHQLAAIAYNAMMEFYFITRGRVLSSEVQGESRSPESEG